MIANPRVTVPLVAVLRLPDGREFEVHETARVDEQSYPGDNPFDGTVSYWTEGNMSCDCNKTLVIDRQHGTSLDDGKCGDTILLVRLTIDGVDIEL